MGVNYNIIWNECLLYEPNLSFIHAFFFSFFIMYCVQKEKIIWPLARKIQVWNDVD